MRGGGGEGGDDGEGQFSLASRQQSWAGRMGARRAKSWGGSQKGEVLRTVYWPLHKAHGVHCSRHVLGCGV